MVVESSDDCDLGRVRSVVGRWLPEFEMTSTTKLGEVLIMSRTTSTPG
jgi:hypothetical protein